MHENGYRTMDGAELRDAFGYKASTSGFDAWCTAFHNRKYDSGFAREMSRSVAVPTVLRAVQVTHKKAGSLSIRTGSLFFYLKYSCARCAALLMQSRSSSSVSNFLLGLR